MAALEAVALINVFDQDTPAESIVDPVPGHSTNAVVQRARADGMLGRAFMKSVS